MAIIFGEENFDIVNFDSESIANLGAKIYNLIPEDIKASETLDTFISKIKRWCPQSFWGQTLQDTYVNQVGLTAKWSRIHILA